MKTAIRPIVAVVALLGASALATAPAQAQTTLWSATLTVKVFSLFKGCSVFFTENCSVALTSTTFTLAGSTYTVQSVYFTASNRLAIGVNSPPTFDTAVFQNLTFVVDGRQFLFSDGNYTNTEERSERTWDLSAAQQTWRDSLTADQQISVSLVQPAPPPTQTPPALPKNNAPTVSLSCDPCEVTPGGEVRLEATASDPDRDRLSFRWNAEQGSLSLISRAPLSETVRWQAPPVAGRYEVKVEVSDGEDSDSATVEIHVNSPPAVSLSCEERCRVRQGLSVRLEARASDPDGHELSYAWSAGQGSFIGETDGATARWRAPAEAGAMTIHVTVSDTQGGSASAEADVAVDPLSNQSAVFASYLVSIPSDDPDQVIDTYLSVSNVLSAPGGVDTAGSPYEGDDRVGTLEIYLYSRDDDEPMVYETTGDSPGAGLDENGMLAPGHTYTVRLAELVGEENAFVGYGWIVGNFDGIAGTRTILLGQGVTWHGDLTPELSHHGADIKPIPTR